MTPLMEENERLLAAVSDLQPRLLQERHRREDLEVSVEALRREKQQLEAENQATSDQLNRVVGRQKDMLLSRSPFLSFICVLLNNA